MGTRARSADPEIWCDFNGAITERAYMPTYGTVQDLAELGLTLETAVGRRFVLKSDDLDAHGNPDDIMLNGMIIVHPEFGILLEGDDDNFYWRSQLGT